MSMVIEQEGFKEMAKEELEEVEESLEDLEANVIS